MLRFKSHVPFCLAVTLVIVGLVLTFCSSCSIDGPGVYSPGLAQCRGKTERRVTYKGQRGFTGPYLGYGEVRFHPNGPDDPTEKDCIVVSCDELTPAGTGVGGY